MCMNNGIKRLILFEHGNIWENPVNACKFQCAEIGERLCFYSTNIWITNEYQRYVSYVFVPLFVLRMYRWTTINFIIALENMQHLLPFPLSHGLCMFLMKKYKCNYFHQYETEWNVHREIVNRNADGAKFL